MRCSFGLCVLTPFLVRRPQKPSATPTSKSRLLSDFRKSPASGDSKFAEGDVKRTWSCGEAGNILLTGQQSARYGEGVGHSIFHEHSCAVWFTRSWQNNSLGCPAVTFPSHRSSSLLATTVSACFVHHGTFVPENACTRDPVGHLYED